MGHPVHTLRNIILGATGLAAASCPTLSTSEARIVIITPTAKPAPPLEAGTEWGPDKTRQLQELRQWLEKRRLLRGRRELEILGKRQLLTPLGQRYSTPVVGDQNATGRLKLRRWSDKSAKQENGPTPHLPLDLRVGTPSELEAIRNGTPFRFGP